MALLLEMNTVVIRVTPIARTAGYRLAEKLTQKAFPQIFFVATKYSQGDSRTDTFMTTPITSLFRRNGPNTHYLDARKNHRIANIYALPEYAPSIRARGGLRSSWSLRQDSTRHPFIGPGVSRRGARSPTSIQRFVIEFVPLRHRRRLSDRRRHDPDSVEHPGVEECVHGAGINPAVR
jgi:hypothetical protein